jgi:carbamoyl-phosphate synthase large subunit
VLGGRAMMVANNEDELVPFTYAAFAASPGFPVLIDRYLDRAIEVDVDVCATARTYIGGVMEHIEQAGIHSAATAPAAPRRTPCPGHDRADGGGRLPHRPGAEGQGPHERPGRGAGRRLLHHRDQSARLPHRAVSRKATGWPLAKVAAKVSLGMTLKELGPRRPAARWNGARSRRRCCPSTGSPGVDPILGPEMKSTGEVMGIDAVFELAYWKSQIAAGQQLPMEGTVFLSARDSDKAWMIEIPSKWPCRWASPPPSSRTPSDAMPPISGAGSWRKTSSRAGGWAA